MNSVHSSAETAHRLFHRRSYLAAAATALALSGCGGDSNCLYYGTCYTVGGSLAGLLTNSSVTLQNNGSDNLTLSNNGGFSFDQTVDSSRNFTVTVLTQPVGQACTIFYADGYGPADANVNVTCTPNRHTLGGTLNGLAPGTTVTLQNNGANSLALAADGSFRFPTNVRYGDVYSVTVSAQPIPPTRTCVVTNGTGTVPDGDISTVSVTCQ
jgi:large repetitive protein